MAPRTTKRRQRGEGTISAYLTKAGERFLIKYSAPQPDGSSKMTLKRGYTTRKAAADALGDINADIRRGAFVAATDETLGEWLDQWVDGLRLVPSSMASYRKNIRLHITPRLGKVALVKLTGPMITKMYRELETSGRTDHKAGEGLSARSVRYVHTILKAALADAVRNGKLLKNPAELATPPSAKEARAPEMHPWTAVQLKAFLDWANEHRADIAPAWRVLAYTGMRRGELLALRWRDIDLEAGRISVRRSLTPVRTPENGLQLVEGTTKGGHARVVDLDADTVAVIRAHRKARGALSLALVRDQVHVFANEEGEALNPDRFTRRFTTALASMRNKLDDEDAVPAIRLHDLRHTHATLLLQAGVPVKVVSERLGHASVTITLGIYAHVMPGMQQEAANRFAAIVGGLG